MAKEGIGARDLLDVKISRLASLIAVVEEKIPDAGEKELHFSGSEHI